MREWQHRRPLFKTRHLLPKRSPRIEEFTSNKGAIETYNVTTSLPGTAVGRGTRTSRGITTFDGWHN